MRVNFIDVGGLDTRCIVAGPRGGRPLVLLHGLTLIAEIWTPHIAMLEREGFFVVAPDMAGSGFTDEPADDGRPMIPHKVQHVCDLVEHLGFETFSLSGSSYGALIAVHVYLRMRDRVDRLIINGSGTCFNSEEEIAANMRQTHKNLGAVLATGSRSEWRQRVAQSCFDSSVAPDDLVALLMTCYARAGAVAVWERTIRDMIEPERFAPFSIRQRLNEIDVDTLVIWGRDDRGAPYQNAINAVPQLRRARLVAFEKCGHMPMLEHPGAYSETVLGFLGL